MSRRSTRQLGLFAVLSLFGLQLTGLAASPVVAADALTVDGSCTLADAIDAANTDAAVGECATGSGADTITLAVDVSLTEPLPRVTSSITIEGAGHVIERAEDAPDFRLFDVEESVFRLNQVTLANGAADRVANGEAGGGGAILAWFASISITDSTIRNNSARFGAAIAVVDAGVTVTRSTITDNDAADSGGGVHVRTTGTGSGGVTLVDSTMSNNKARVGGAIAIGGDASLNSLNSTITGNGLPADVEGTQGGGIAVFSARGVIRNTTIADNTAAVAGGIWVPSPDLSGDPGYETPSRPTLEGSILANPVGGECGPLSLDLGSGGHNLVVGDDDCGLDEPTDLVGANPDLGPLQDNGGPTLTHALGAASDAIDAIPTSACTVSTDQRGVARPQDDGCDIGAYEVAGSAPVLTCGDISGTAGELAALGYNVIIGTDDADFLPGTPGDDFILGLDGKDVILAGMGDDVVCAGPSHDVVVGGGGVDSLHGDDGNDKVWGGNQDDLITGGAGKDLLVGGNGDDDVSGDGADDTIRGGHADDVLRGGSGKDDIRGDAGNDMLFGDGADDVLRGHAGVDVCDGGTHVSGDQAFSCETVIDVP